MGLQLALPQIQGGYVNRYFKKNLENSKVFSNININKILLLILKPHKEMFFWHKTLLV